jgi:hypothetical protein
MPHLRACPVTASNPTFPACKFPAERPIYTNENCHSCERVLWNIEVLRKEEEHRQMHKHRTCHCEVIFDAEERERRLRPRGTKGKGKGKNLAHTGFGGQCGDEGEAAATGVAGMSGTAGASGVAAAFKEGHGFDTSNTGMASRRGVAEEQFHIDRMGDGMGTRNGVAEAEPRNPRQDWASDSQIAAYKYVGYHTGGTGNGPAMAPHGQRGGFSAGGNTQVDLLPMVQRPGYPAGSGVGRVDLDQVAEGCGFPVGGGVPREYLWEDQLEIGQPGAGMKWYPQQHAANMPPVLDLDSPPTSIFDRMPRTWQRSKSEPPKEINHPVSSALHFARPVTVAVAVAVAVAQPEPQQPAIVSSGMAR